ncbi:MAG: FAD-binding oxidoreductase [Acidimicrobiales bacterium]
MTRPIVAPVPIEGGAEAAAQRLGTRPVAVPAAIIDEVRDGGGTVDTGIAGCAEAGRDWWPISIGWAAAGQVPTRPAAVVRPVSTAQVADLLRACTDAQVPVTPTAGRSGVCGGAVPLFGGVALDVTGLTGEVCVDERSLVVEVPAGVNGRDLDDVLRATGEGYTLGHWPQSIDLSTVGGWVACRSAGQYSTRYGKIEDMVAGLEVVLADGRVVRTGHAPRAATGPDLTQLFTGSEGVLGVITRVWLRVHPAPPAEGRRAYGFAGFAEGTEACRRILRRGATPAVLRLYDRAESERTFADTGHCVLLVLDEADPGLLAATLEVVDDECAAAERLDDGLVGHWLDTRNDVSQLATLWHAGIVVDTAELASYWAGIDELGEGVVRALEKVDGTLAVSRHLSHAYTDGGCVYFTFAGRRPEGGTATVGTTSRATAGARPDVAWAEGYYTRAWDALSAVAIDQGAAISHHHGVGIQRARFLRDALGEGFGVLVDMKRALDPAGILNPGKLGIPNPFGEVPWP